MGVIINYCHFYSFLSKDIWFILSRSLVIFTTSKLEFHTDWSPVLGRLGLSHHPPSWISLIVVYTYVVSNYKEVELFFFFCLGLLLRLRFDAEKIIAWSGIGAFPLDFPSGSEMAVYCVRSKCLWSGCHLFHSVQCFPVYLSFRSFSTANGFT